MSKEKILSIVLVIAGFVFAIYFGYNNYQEKKQLKTANTELTNKIEQLEKKAETDNKIVASNEQEKVKLENQSQQRQEQMNEQLKDNDCANRFVPMPVSASLYNRAKGIRESTYTGKSIK